MADSDHGVRGLMLNQILNSKPIRHSKKHVYLLRKRMYCIVQYQQTASYAIKPEIKRHANHKNKATAET